MTSPCDRPMKILGAPEPEPEETRAPERRLAIVDADHVVGRFAEIHRLLAGGPRKVAMACELLRELGKEIEGATYDDADELINMIELLRADDSELWG